MPGKHRWHGVTDLPFNLSQAGHEDELVWKRLQAGCLTHGNASWQVIVELNVSMALRTDRIAGAVGDKTPIPLLWALVREAPDVVDVRRLRDLLKVTNGFFGCDPIGGVSFRVGWREGSHTWGCSDN